MSARLRSRLAAACAAAGLLACVSSARAEDDGPVAVGSLAWIVSDDLDLVGTIAAAVPFARAKSWRFDLDVRATTGLELGSGFTFLVDEVCYAAAFDARRPLGDGRGAVSLYAGEQGRQFVDDVGRWRVRTVGAAWESDGFRGAYASDGWAGAVSVGGVVEDVGVDAIATSSGGVRWMRRVRTSPGVSAGVELGWDALVGRDGGADVLVGPRFDFDLGGDRRFGLHLRWLSGGNPLGLETDGVLIGFDFAQGPARDGRPPAPPEIVGFVAAGGGDGGRGLARLDIRVQTPPFLGETYGEIEVNGNALTGNGANDLFYEYDVGVAHPFAGPWRAGGWFFHRSNHVLDAVNPTVTSVNVVQAGVETVGWNRPDPGVPLGRAGAIDLVVRAGWVVDSSLSSDAAWQAVGGVRYASPDWGAVRPYASVDVQRGNALASSYAVGILLPRGFDLRVAAVHDAELFDDDHRGVFGIVTLRY